MRRLVLLVIPAALLLMAAAPVRDWQERPLQLQAGDSFGELALDGKTAWLLNTFRLYRCENNGAAWDLAFERHNTDTDCVAAQAGVVWLATSATDRDHYALMRSSDGGESWAEYPLSQGFEAIEFLNPHRGWAATAGWRIDGPISVLTTADGGRSWETVATFPEGLNIRALTFVSAKKGWALLVNDDPEELSVAEVLATSDGGRTWQVTHTMLDPDFNTYGLSFSGGTGWLQTGGQIFRSLDGGKSWQLDYERTDEQVLYDVEAEGGRVWSDGERFLLVRE